MTNQGDQPNPGSSRELNLKKMAEQFAIGLQRHFDMLAFNLASRECVTEEAYAHRVRVPQIMPAASLHHNFEQMQAYAGDLLSRQLLSDALNLAVHCMNNAHLFLTLVKAKREHGALHQDAQRGAQEAQQEFLKVPLDQKFNRLEERFGIMCELEDSLVSMGFALQALNQQKGLVREAQLDDDGQLILELKVAKAGTSGGDLWRRPDDLETSRKVFSEGERIRFSDTELQNILLTIGVFGRQLFASVSQYVRDNHEESR